MKRLSIKREAENVELQDEIVHQMKFASDRAKLFIGRTLLINTISFLVKTKNIFIFTGASGSGKSSFLSKLAIELQTKANMIPSRGFR